MLKQLKNKQKSLSDKVAELLVRDGSEESDESADETTPRVADFNEEEYEVPDGRSTEIRKKNVKLLSEQSAKYRGMVATRKDLEMEEDLSDDSQDSEEEADTDSEDGDSEDEEDFDGDLASFTQRLKKSGRQVNESDDETEEDNENEVDDANDPDSALASLRPKMKISGLSRQIDDVSDEGDDSEDDEDDEEAEIDEDDAFATENEADSTNMVSETNRQAEIQRGLCVQNQLRIWERLLEFRMRSQKIITKANGLPAPAKLQEQGNHSTDLQSALSETTENTTKLLKSLLDLQHTLYGQCSELKNDLKSKLKRSSPFDTKSSEPPAKKLIGDYIEQRFNDFRSYRNSVLLKWDDRTKLLTPGAGAKRKSQQEEYDIIKKIENSLMNRSALIDKSRVLKTNTDPTSMPTTNREQQAERNSDSQTRYNANVYDDNDFYHQQLRELIEYKANVMSSVSDVTKQYIELQKLRQKMKKKVDTRASKGRKLRYVVHNKLLNFMAPDDTTTWTEESKNELYKSLFA